MSSSRNNAAPRLRAVEEADLEVLRRIDTDPELSQPFAWTGFRDYTVHRRRWESDGYLGDEDALLVVGDSQGAFRGLVSWGCVGPRRPLGCVEIAVFVLPAHRGRGIGTAAHRLLAEYLFETSPVNRVQAITEVDNTMEQRALATAGFTREGVLRGYGFMRGAWRDGVMYSRLREDGVS